MRQKYIAVTSQHREVDYLRKSKTRAARRGALAVEACVHRPRPVRGAYCDSVVKQNGAGSNPLLAAPASVRIAAVPSARKPCDSPFGAVCGGWASGAPRVLGSSNEYSNGLRAMMRS